MAPERGSRRSPSGSSPIQEWLRKHSAEFIQGLESEGELVGIVVLGAKSNGAAKKTARSAKKVSQPARAKKA